MAGPPDQKKGDGDPKKGAASAALRGASAKGDSAKGDGAKGDGSKGDGSKKETSEGKGKRMSLRAYLRSRPDPLTGLVLTLPVFLLYHLGLLAIDIRNGADWLTALTLQLLENKLAYAGVTLGIGALLVSVTWILRRTGRIQGDHTPRSQAPWLLAESALLALLMSTSVGWATGKLFQTGAASSDLNFVEKLVLSAGAGFHEELLFRVVLFAGGSWTLALLVPTILPKLFGKKPKSDTESLAEELKTDLEKATEVKPEARGFWRRVSWSALLLAAVLSSLAFSAAHYIGPMGDAFTLSSFFFRWLGGLYLCAVFRYRGFPVVVWTHFLYDLFVFFF